MHDGLKFSTGVHSRLGFRADLAVFADDGVRHFLIVRLILAAADFLLKRIHAIRSDFGNIGKIRRERLNFAVFAGKADFVFSRNVCRFCGPRLIGRLRLIGARVLDVFRLLCVTSVLDSRVDLHGLTPNSSKPFWPFGHPSHSTH